MGIFSPLGLNYLPSMPYRVNDYIFNNGPFGSPFSSGTGVGVAGNIYLAPYIPLFSFLSTSISLRVQTGVAAATAQIVIYSNQDFFHVPEKNLYSGTVIDCSTSGAKTSALNNFIFTKGITYWLGFLIGGTSATMTWWDDGITYMSSPTADALAVTSHVGGLQYNSSGAIPASMPATISSYSIVHAPIIGMNLAAIY